MLSEIHAASHQFLYGAASTFGPVEVCLRTVVVYVAAIATVRIGKKRFMSQQTGFDTLIAFILGSVLSRAVNGTSPLPETILAGFVLVGVHAALTVASLSSARLRRLMNGRANEIVRDGVALNEPMRRHGITRDDLYEALRANGHVEDMRKVKTAFLERSGRISVVPAEKPPRIIDIEVKDGIQKVRLEL